MKSSARRSSDLPVAHPDVPLAATKPKEDLQPDQEVVRLPFGHGRDGQFKSAMGAHFGAEAVAAGEAGVGLSDDALITCYIIPDLIDPAGSDH